MLFQTIFVWDQTFVRAGSDAQRLAIPHGGTVGRQDRPAHASEPPHEERRGRFQNIMVGLEPGDEGGLAVRRLDLFETDEGMHLVDVAMYGLFHFARGINIAVASVGEEMRGLPETPQQAIEQSKTFGIGMCDDLLRERDEGLRDIEVRSVRTRGNIETIGGEQVARVVTDLPDNILGRNTGEHGSARRRPPSLEIRLIGKRNALHANSSNCCAGVTFAFRLALSVRPPGCQSAQVMNGMTFFND